MGMGREIGWDGCFWKLEDSDPEEQDQLMKLL